MERYKSVIKGDRRVRETRCRRFDEFRCDLKSVSEPNLIEKYILYRNDDKNIFINF